MTIINESSLYDVILRSDKPFRKWVTCEVLPTIRKTGTYSPQLPELSSMQSQINDIRGNERFYYREMIKCTTD